MLSTSGFVFNRVMFSHNRASGPKSSTMLFRLVRQVTPRVEVCRLPLHFVKICSVNTVTFDIFQGAQNNLSRRAMCVWYEWRRMLWLSVVEQSRWLRSCWQTGCRCVCTLTSRHTSTSRCSCCTKRSSTRRRRDLWTPWQPRHDTRCPRTDCWDRKLTLEHWSAAYFSSSIDKSRWTCFCWFASLTGFRFVSPNSMQFLYCAV